MVDWLWPGTSPKSPASAIIIFGAWSKLDEFSVLPGLCQLSMLSTGWTIATHPIATYLGGSTQGINNAATMSTEWCYQTNQIAWSTRPYLVDNSRPSLAPSEVSDYIQAVSDDACSQQPSMSWMHRWAAHRDVFCYFTLQTAIGFQQSLWSSSDSTKVWIELFRLLDLQLGTAYWRK